jgi:hypothetical protein
VEPHGFTISETGTKRWYQNGQLHREDGPAIEFPDGLKLWYRNNKLHRTDGPALENEFGDKRWYVNNKMHRLDGPAAEYKDGYKEWWIQGREYTEEEFHAKLLKHESCDLIEELINMLRLKSLTEEEEGRLNEIEDFAVNRLGED